MADKYPSLSPYNYCAWNPIKIVDPNGDSVYIKGEAAEQAANQLSSMGLTVTLDKKTGSLSYTKTGKDLTDSDKQLISAIKSKKIIVIVNATNEKTFCFESEAISNSKLCGQFLGVTLSDCKSRKAKTLQLVNPNTCEKRDAECEVLIGTSMRHEVTESFQAGKICLKKGISCGPCWDTWHGMEINGLDDHVYWEAHGKATPQAETFKRRKEMAKEQIRAELYKAIR